MRKALIITLVLVMLVTGIPILIGGMSMGSCHDCGVATVAGVCSAATLVMLGSFIAMLLAFMRPRLFLCQLEIVYGGLDRPPRLI